MAVIKCKMCGGDLELVPDATVCECEYCGTRQTVPTADNEKKLTLFSRAGRLLRACEFDKAAGVYESIIADFPQEAEAYWGLVLCKYGIEYVDDPATGKKIPTCHRSSFESVLDDVNYDQACENTDAVARRVYRDEARQIESLREAILSVSGTEEPYDVFISYKETDDSGERTVDSVLAQDIYRELTREGYRVFFSRISLENKLGTEYEPYIFAALNSAKVMLVVGTDYENLDAVWVKNEWSRFLKLIAKGEKKTLIPVFKDMDAYDMPKEFSKLAGLDMGKVGAMQDLLHGVEKIIPLNKPEPEPAFQSAVVSGSPNVASLLRRVQIFLEDRDWENARAYCEKALDIDPENADAYLFKALAKFKAQTIEEVPQKSNPTPKAEIPSGMFAVTLTSFGSNKSKVIKTVREISRMGLAEAITFVENLPQELTVNQAQYKELVDAGATVMISGTEVDAAASNERISVILLDYGKDKIRAIAGIRANLGVGVAEAKEIAESLPRDMTMTRMQLQALQNAGITAVSTEEKVVPSSNPEDLSFFKDSDYQKFLRFASDAQRAEQEQRLSAAAGEYQRQAETEAKRRAEEMVVLRKELEQAREDEAKRLAEEANEVTINKGIDRMRAAVCAPDFLAAAEIFASIPGWANADELAKQCRDRAAEIQAECEAFAKELPQLRARIAPAQGLISAGLLHTNAVRMDGVVMSAGDPNLPQCRTQFWNGILSLSSGLRHTLGVHTNGTVYAVGDRDKKYDFGQCDVAFWSRIVQVAGGSLHTVGLREDGTVTAAGRNNYHASEVSEWTDIVKVAAGSTHTLGLRADGTVVATGDNENHCCETKNLANIVDIAAGKSQSYFLRADGVVLPESLGWRKIVAIEARGEQLFGLRADGTVVSKKLQSEEIASWTDVVAIAAGTNHVAALRADGTVVAAGDNEGGQCNVNGWRLFDHLEQFTAFRDSFRERAAEARKAEAERLEAERRRMISALATEANAIQPELKTIEVLIKTHTFNNGPRIARKNALEARLKEIQEQLEQLSKV